MDGKGRVIYHRNTSLFGADLATTEPVMSVVEGNTGAVVADDITGERVVSGYAPVPGTSWGVVTQEEWSNVIGPIQSHNRVLLALLILGGVISTVLIFFAIGRVLKPIKALTRGAQRIAGGDFDYAIASTSGDEVQALAHQFNTMAGALKESYTDLERKVAARTEELRESEEKYRYLFDGSTDAIYVTSTDGRFVDVNQATLDLFRYTKEEAMQIDVLPLYRRAEDRARLQEEMERHGSVQ